MPRFLLSALLLLAAGGAFAQTLVINEFLASNTVTAADQNGDYDDWIELYNAGDTPLALGGYYLSDDRDEPRRWAFPDTAIAAGGFLLVWADEDSGQSGLHANFKLSAAGERVLLADSGATVLDEIAYGPQLPDVSDGRYPDGGALWRVMTPTPGAPNDSTTPGVEPGEGFFGESLIHTIALEFYTPAWADSLQYNYEVLDHEYLPVRVIVDGALTLDSVGIRYKGHSSYEQSRNTPKKPFKLSFNEYRPEQTLLGLHRVNLSSAVSDPSFLRETLGYGIARRYLPAPRTAYADVFVNGERLGLYVLVEQVDKVLLSRYFSNDGGNLFKAGSDGAALEYHGDDPSAYDDEYALKTNEDENDWSRLTALLAALNSTGDAGFVDSVGRLLDFESALRVMAYNMALSNFDSYTGSGRNFYLYDDPASGRFHVLPWDVNESFGVYTNGWDVVTQDVFTASNLNYRPLCRRLLANDSLRTVYEGYLRDLLTGAASADSVTAAADRLWPLLEAHVQADSNKLYSMAAFYNNIEADVYIGIGRRIPGIKSFIRARTANLRLQVSPLRVWPGDTDNNGVVNAQDVLAIGVYFLQTGVPRDSASAVWGAHRAAGWTDLAATWADANGDGVVSETDVVVIGLNWGNTHSASAPAFAIDTANKTLFARHAASLRTLLSALTGESAAVRAMRAALWDALGESAAPPVEFALAQNYPNPFNARTVIAFTLPERQAVTLTVINLLGQVVATPLDRQVCDAGSQSVSFDAGALPSGLYFYRLETLQGRKLRKLVVLK